MKVILTQELKGKGGEGDVVEVAPGFANNYLFIEGIAIPATKGNLKQLEQRKHNIAKREEKRLADAHALQEQLSALSIHVDAQVGEEGVLFGSVTSQMVADALAAQAGIEIDRRSIQMGAPIKKAGAHEVTVSIYRDIKAPVAITVGKAEEVVEEAAEEAAETEAVVAEAIEAVEAEEIAEEVAEEVAEAVAEETVEE